MDNKLLLVMAVLGGISEALSLIPSIKSNGIFQLISNALKALLGKKE
jgi:hypothetical protein